MFRFICANTLFCIGIVWILQSFKLQDFITPAVVGVIHIYASWKIYGLKP